MWWVSVILTAGFIEPKIRLLLIVTTSGICNMKSCFRIPQIWSPVHFWIRLGFSYLWTKTHFDFFWGGRCTPSKFWAFFRRLAKVSLACPWFDDRMLSFVKVSQLVGKNVLGWKFSRPIWVATFPTWAQKCAWLNFEPSAQSHLGLCPSGLTRSEMS